MVGKWVKCLLAQAATGFGRFAFTEKSVWALSAQAGNRKVRLTAERLSNQRCALWPAGIWTALV